MNILSVYEKLEHLVSRLPQPLQSPILREVGPIKTLFLQQRTPRILLLGDRAASRSALVNALFSDAVAETAEDHLQDGAWQVFSSPSGKLRVLDARRPVAASLLRRALASEPPDLCLYSDSGADPADDLARAREILPSDEPLPIIGVVMGVARDEVETARHHLHSKLEQGVGNMHAKHVAGVFVPALGAVETHKLTAAIATALPGEARLEMARLSGVRDLQHDVARALVKSTAAICGAVGAQPIPLADFPILTALQGFMVAGIMHISGRPMNAKLAAEFVAALGANIGVGLVLREGSRALLKFIPIWGDLVSGGIAAAGTYAVGKAASAYFIDGISISDARRIYREKKERKQLK